MILIAMSNTAMKKLFPPLCGLVLLAGCATTSPKLNQLTSDEKQAGWTPPG
jgi:uncharacterized lipoprotein YajG